MNHPLPLDWSRYSWWTRFWHQPVRAERLALVRILLGLSLLLDQIIQYLPNLGELFGASGVAFAGLHDEFLLDQWRWTILVFGTDNPTVVRIVFGVWMAATVGFVLGWRTRLMNVVVWFLAMCFINRNPIVKNGGDDVMNVGLFLLMFMPTGAAFSLDRLGQLRRDPALAAHPPRVPAWGVRVLQIQLCMLYLTTGLAKLRGGPDTMLEGTWWQGTSVYYVLQDITMARVAYAELPLPFWVTAAMTYSSVWFETLFPLLVLLRPTRKWALWFGVLFHLGIYLLIEVGWFSFYTCSMYGAWVPGEFWDRRLGRKWAEAPPQGGA
jgi:hypothetical protein